MYHIVAVGRNGDRMVIASHLEALAPELAGEATYETEEEAQQGVDERNALLAVLKPLGLFKILDHYEYEEIVAA